MTSYDNLPYVEAALNYLAPMAERPHHERRWSRLLPGVALYTAAKFAVEGLGASVFALASNNARA